MATHPGLRLPSYFERKRKKAARNFEPVVFKPIRRNPLVPQSKIKMLNTVHGKNEDGSHFNLTPDGGEAENGEYWVDASLADEYVVKGYAEGTLSRDYSDDEKAQIRSNVQIITNTPEVTHG